MAPSDPHFQLAAGAASRLLAAAEQESSSGAAALALDDAIRAIVAEVVDGGVADWCLVELCSEGSRETRLVAVAHRDAAEIERARAAHGRLAPGDGSQLTDELGLPSSVTVPLTCRGLPLLGTLTLAGAAGSLGAKERELANLIGGLLAGALATAYLVVERDEILGVVSHDLRNPLGVILLVVDLLRGIELPPEVAGQMSRLERASQSMSRIITDVVDIGRVGTPSVPLDLKPVSAAAVLDSACQTSAAVAEARNVSIERSADPALELVADGDRLVRALDLLVSGAVQRTPAKRAVTLSVERQSDSVVWSVADGAPPLPPDPAITGSAAIRRRTGAFTWMFIRGVVRAHGGTLWIVETPERVTVRFALPVAVAARTTVGSSH